MAGRTGGGVTGVVRVLDAAAIRRWADASVERLDARRAELDRINVFPVPDADTGTNLAQTVRAAAEAVHRTGRGGSARDAAVALARGALRGARGNSGVIVSQLFRGLAEALADQPAGDGAALAAGLSRADELARAAVSRPVEGTVLTVLRAAAHGAARSATDTADLPEVLAAALEHASAALADTPRELPELARAGVVDAGGQGLVVLLEALAEVLGVPVERVCAGDAPSGAEFGLHARDASALVAPRETGSTRFDYEVMYLLADSSAERVARLRERLSELGDSVVVAGDGVDEHTPDDHHDDGGGGLWHVHVHCTDVGAAVEAGLAEGRPHRITVIRFADQDGEPAAERFRTRRAVVTVVSGSAVAELVRADGVTVLDAERAPSVSTLAAAITGTGARHVVVLPNDIDRNPLAEEAAELARDGGQEVVVVPTSSVLQGLAALAVHDPARRPGDDVVAMAEAAAATRTGVLQIAEQEALTWAGHCQAGDVLGMVDGEVVLIDRDLSGAACTLVDLMLTAGGELVTVLLGEAGDAPDLGALLDRHLRHGHPEVEVVLYRGGPPGSPLQLGVE